MKSKEEIIAKYNFICDPDVLETVEAMMEEYAHQSGPRWGTDRFFIDERSGCIAVRDKLHPKFDPDYPGLHFDTPDVIYYGHGQRSENEGEPACWTINDMVKIKAYSVLEHLMSISESSPASNQPTPGGGGAVPDQFIDKHLAKVMELTIDSYISTHIEKMYGGLEMASIKHFVETGKVNGSFHIRLKEMMMEFAKQWGKTANRLSTPHSSEGMAEALPGWLVELLTELRFRLLVDIDEDGEPRSSMVELLEMWDKVNKVLHINSLASLSPAGDGGSGKV